MKRRVIAAFTATILFAGATVTFAHSSTITAGLPAIKAKTEAARAERTDVQSQLAAAVEEREQLTATISGRQSLLDARPAFLESVRVATETIAAADGQVPTSTVREVVADTQAKVLAAVTSADVEAATMQVIEASGKLATQNSTLFTRARAILDNAGGGWVHLAEYSGNCGGVSAVACNLSDGSIRVSPSFANLSYDRKVWAMTHELAHSYQRKVWNRIMSSPTYRSMFGGSIELLANCMASARGATAHGHHCTPSMIGWASNIWNGSVPG